MKKPIGQTKTAGFQFGIRKTFSISNEEAWNFLFSDEGLAIWLGKLNNDLEATEGFETENGISGQVRVFKPNSVIRMKYRPKDWKNTSTVQVRVIGNQEKATIAIHQEQLSDAAQRLEMKEYWTKIMKKIAAEIE